MGVFSWLKRVFGGSEGLPRLEKDFKRFQKQMKKLVKMHDAAENVEQRRKIDEQIRVLDQALYNKAEQIRHVEGGETVWEKYMGKWRKMKDTARNHGVPV